MLTVIASMERELAGLRSRTREPKSWAIKGGRPIVSGAPGLEMHVLGVGPSAGPALTSLLQNRDDTDIAPSGLLMLGVAGAVQPGLKTGDLVLSSRYYRQDFDAQPDCLEPDPGLWQWALAAADESDRPVVYADSLTVRGLVTTADAKQDIHRRHPVAIVNMEDYWTAQAAQDAGVPFISVRAVLDTAQQSLPDYLCRMAASPRSAMAGAVAVPWRLPSLFGLWLRFGIAQRALTDFAVNFLAQASRDVPVSVGANSAERRSAAA